MSIRILHLADAHLGAPLANFGDYARQRHAEQEEAFTRAIDHALAERVHLVLIAGDLFDTFRPDPASVNLVRRQLGRLREAGIVIAGVPGTHDSLGYAECVYHHEALPFHHFFTGPTFAGPAELEIAGVPVALYGIAYDTKQSGGGWDSLVRTSTEGLHIALVHAACRFNPEWPIPPDDLPFAAEDLARLNMDYVALGHYHNMREFRDGERLVGAYSGSLEGRDWTEPGPRHVLLIEWQRPGDAPSLRALPVQSRTLGVATVDVSGAPDQEAMAERIAAACEPGPLWRITLTGEPEAVPQPAALEAQLAARYDHLQIVDSTTLVASHLVAQRCEEETVRGEFFRRLVAQRAAAADERERAVADRAIKLGVRVFG
ncbi:MAG: exonuclease SbcCD subunit D [Gemmatimonadota bacterium]